MITQNTKMRMSSDDKHKLVNFSIPAFRASNGFVTCPSAGICASFCYAKKAFYKMRPSQNAHNRNLDITKTEDFYALMLDQIDAKQSSKKLVFRIHDAGDFYNLQYVKKWIKIIEARPKVFFYFYTKRVMLFKKIKMPKNTRVIFSFGGKEDHLINEKKDFHSKVFDIVPKNYADASHDDKVAAFGKNKRIGLVLH